MFRSMFRSSASSNEDSELTTLVESFRQELGAQGSTAAEVVASACEALGVERTGSTKEQAQRCWVALHGTDEERLARALEASSLSAPEEISPVSPPPVVHQPPSFGLSAALPGSGAANHQHIECYVCFDDLCAEPCAGEARGLKRMARAVTRSPIHASSELVR